MVITIVAVVAEQQGVFSITAAAYFAESNLLLGVVIDAPLVDRYRPQTFAELQSGVDAHQPLDSDGHKLLAVDRTSVGFLGIPSKRQTPSNQQPSPAATYL